MITRVDVHNHLTMTGKYANHKNGIGNDFVIITRQKCILLHGNCGRILEKVVLMKCLAWEGSRSISLRFRSRSNAVGT